MSPGCSLCSPLGISCEKGFLDPRACPNFQGTGSNKPDAVPSVDEDVHLMPWTGNSLGSRGLSFVTARGAAHLVGIIGLNDAGKSTFLLMLYLLLSRGYELEAGKFTGSITLGGWDHLARRMRLTSPDQPRFPPHTPIGAGRHPGMFHLALRTPENRLRDLLLTDASGEWFREWINDPASHAAEGARWIVDRADAFLLLIDCERLSGSPSTVAGPFSQTLRLAERLRDQANGRRVGIVWAKADHSPIPEIRRRLQDQLDRLFPGHGRFEVTIDAVRDETDERREHYLHAVDWAARPRVAGIRLPQIAGDAADLLFRIGG